ncbi:MAG: hypothetical protein VX975_08840 [Acidobacteriota bacterium]|nr:hypothetical protein [Acidobacteriota bacterium]
MPSIDIPRSHIRTSRSFSSGQPAQIGLRRGRCRPGVVGFLGVAAATGVGSTGGAVSVAGANGRDPARLRTFGTCTGAVSGTTRDGSGVGVAATAAAEDESGMK